MNDSISDHGAATSPPFTWGVASGDPTSTSVWLWTRVDAGVVADSQPVRWEMWEEGRSPDRAVRTGDEAVGDDGTVRLEVTGLEAGTRFGFRFGVAGSWSVTGTTATLDPDAAVVRLGIACCARRASGQLEAYEGLRLARPDLVVHLGDYIYEDGGRSDDADEPEPPHECRTFDDYTTRYAQYRRDPNLQRLHQACPWVLTPDDHEITDDAFPPEHRSEEPPVDPPTPGRRTAAVRARDRWMPQAPHGNGPTEFDRVVPLGDVGTLVMVDTRLGGREQVAGTGPTPVVDTDEHDAGQHDAGGRRSLLSEAQWEWFDDAIAGADGGWLIIASQVQVSPLRLGWLPRLTWPPRWRPVVNPDQWDGYPADRERLLALVERHDPEKVLILSGDLHARFVSTLSRSNGHPIVEVTTPSVTAPTFATLLERRLPFPSRWRMWRLIAWWIRLINPHIVEMDLDRHGTTLLEVSSDEIVVAGLSPVGAATNRWTVTRDGLA